MNESRILFLLSRSTRDIFYAESLDISSVDFKGMKFRSRSLCSFSRCEWILRNLFNANLFTDLLLNFIIFGD